MTLAALARGSRLGRYRIVVKVAEGGMGAVYVASLDGAASFRRLVALKVIQPYLANDPEVLAMLMDEARLAGQIRHANVVSVLEAVVDAETPFIAMDYVEGFSVAALLHEIRSTGGAALPPAIALKIAGDALAGIHAAHEAKSDDGVALGIVHRDVSPHNVLVGTDGVARLIDFGIAEARARYARTQTGHVKGKPHYMSPEQAAEQPIDRRTDVFSMASTLWEMLTGERFIRAKTTVAAVTELNAGAVRRLGEVRPELPPELDEVLGCALARRPEERFSTANDFANALEGVARRCELLTSTREVAGWVTRTMDAEIERLREARRGAVESHAPSLEGTTSITAAGGLVERPPRRWARPLGFAVAAASVVAGTVLGLRAYGPFSGAGAAARAAAAPATETTTATTGAAAPRPSGASGEPTSGASAAGTAAATAAPGAPLPSPTLDPSARAAGPRPLNRADAVWPRDAARAPRGGAPSRSDGAPSRSDGAPSRSDGARALQPADAGAHPARSSRAQAFGEGPD